VKGVSGVVVQNLTGAMELARCMCRAEMGRSTDRRR
jgi:hypothetical protein